MKNIYILLFLITLSATAFSQPYYIYTAKANGLWSVSGNWDIKLRTDGISKNKMVIPKNITMIVDKDIKEIDLGDVDIYISGTMAMSSSINLNLSQNSSIELNNGTISGSSSNQKIKIGNDIKYKGSVDGILTGNYLSNGTTGSSPSGFVNLSMLPVNFTSFYINKANQNIRLNWSTDNEINNSHFDVEKSADGVNWLKVGVVIAGNNRITNNYSYNDKISSSPVVYYRLRQVDIDGRSSFSSIKAIRTGETIPAVKIYSSEKNVVIDLNSAVKSNLFVSVINSNGQVISKRAFNNAAYKINFHLDKATPGTYIVHVADNKGMNAVKKIIL